MKRLETPQVLTNVYRDLRDRRLLIPAVALLVAILAVPFLLAKGEAPVAPAAVPPTPEGAAEVEAAVLAEQSGIRNYRKRLSALREQNPFETKISAPAVGGGGNGASDASDVGIPGTPSPDAAPAVDVGGGTPTTSTSGGSPSPTTPPLTDPSTDASEPVRDIEPPQPEIRFYAGRVEISFGALGKEGREYDDVRELDLLPDDKNPLVAFTGLAGNGEHAVFSLSPSIVNTSGEGSCAPKKPDPCRFLRLGEGQVRYLKTENGTTYKLRLRETNLVRIPDPREDRGSDDESAE